MKIAPLQLFNAGKETPTAVSSAPEKARKNENAKKTIKKDEGSSTSRDVKKRKALVAVQPRIELTLDESNFTVVDKLFGRSVSRRWPHHWRSKRWYQALMVACIVVWLVSTWLVLLHPSLSRHERDLITFAAILPCTTINLLNMISMMNFHILKQSLTVFDTLILLLEMAILLGASIVYGCFQAYFSLTVFSFLVYIFSYVVAYDSYSPNVRARIKVALLVGLLKGFAFFGLQLMGKFHGTCSYMFDLQNGLWPVGQAADGQGFTVSVDEFIFNRSFTILYVMIKMMYSALKHADRCVLIRSAIRITENTATINRISSLSTVAGTAAAKDEPRHKQVSACPDPNAETTPQPCPGPETRQKLDPDTALGPCIPPNPSIAPAPARSSSPAGAPSPSFPPPRSLKSSSSESGPRQRILLLAVHNYRELSAQENRTTLMMKVFGERFAKKWEAHYTAWNVLGYVCITLYLVLNIFHAAVPLDVDAVVRVLITSYSLLYISPYVNYHLLVKICLHSIDAWYYVLQILLWVSAWSVGQCNGFYVWFTQLTAALTVIFYLCLYDTIQSSKRISIRYVVAGIWLIFIQCFFMVYFQNLEFQCDFAWKISNSSRGQAGAHSTSSGSGGGGGGVLSAQTFYINRLQTIIFLGFRVVFNIFTKPHQCVILKSDYRLLKLDDEDCQKPQVQAVREDKDLILSDL